MALTPVRHWIQLQKKKATRVPLIATLSCYPIPPLCIVDIADPGILLAVSKTR